MICNNKGPDQPAHPRSIISNFVACFLRRIIPRLASCEKKINFLSSLFSRDSLCRKPRRQVFSRRGLCCLLDSSRTNTSSATDNNIKNIYNEEDIFVTRRKKGVSRGFGGLSPLYLKTLNSLACQRCQQHQSLYTCSM